MIEIFENVEAFQAAIPEAGTLITDAEGMEFVVCREHKATDTKHGELFDLWHGEIVTAADVNFPIHEGH